MNDDAAAHPIALHNKYQRDRELQMPQGETLPYLISHDPELRQDVDARSDGNIYLRLHAETGVIDEAEAICLYNDEPQRVPLVRCHEDPHEETWESRALPQPTSEYYFRIQTVTGQALLGRTGLQASLPKEARYRLPRKSAAAVPSWARNAVFYQIFPDRFHRAGASQDELEPWESPPTQAGFKGGNLRGITEKLPYLEALGITGLWLNPVFCSPSNHRYDTTDFFRVDPLLGSDDELRELIERAHERGIRVILDGVFNHVSEEHPFFQDVVHHGPNSPYWRWFKIRQWPIHERNDAYYAAWWGFGHLPELNLSNPDVQEYLLTVGTYWIHRANIDGWRLDVAGEVPLAFWRRFRQEVRAVKPDAYLLAEVWGDPRPFLQGDTFDATMNYAFRRVTLEFLRGTIDAHACAKHLNRLYYRLPKDVAEVQYNLLSSHDVSRMLHDLDGNTNLAKLAIEMQFAYPGIAAIYYGDEIGLDGGNDPGCREAYPWDLQSSALHDLVATRAQQRRHEPKALTAYPRCEAIDAETLQVHVIDGAAIDTLHIDRKREVSVWTRNATRT